MGLRGKKEGIGVYAHIPFCLGKCPYCAFNSVPAGPAGAPEERYVAAISRELEAVSAREGVEGPPATVYLGGGTPSIFSPRAIRRFIESVERVLGKGAREVTLEANPGTLSPDKLREFRRSGVNRLSIGFQSLDDMDLAALGRAHTSTEAVKTFEWARQAGFANIGVDLIFGSPGQDMRLWEAVLTRAAALRPEHISLYGMTVEEGTPFYLRYGPGRSVLLPGEDAEAEMYQTAVDVLKGAGYGHYEVSNFALPGFESVHNRLYWKGAGYLGVGAGAHSFLPWPAWGRRWWNMTDPEGYMRAVEAGAGPVEGSEGLTREEAMLEAVMLGLRMVEDGIGGEAFRARFGLYPGEALGGLDRLAKDGLVEKRGEDVVLASRGLLLLNEVAARIV